ncbi:MULTISPECIES: 3-dehydroquinate synthase [unclassified Marinobacter]|uniref:3-dehydroquinate synthase n=1 Tax=unclassified Marinobacter TaxID=83889 RepID=UPI00200C61BC|nr:MULTISPECIES: 3-dehydroquinate synthase [unclassified Marinobacter]UQG56837.1 3-dehydroquinate synthase [Marinobacter sp. M4C]UQG65641.1 3-dehydroquinate synthase [Marinobacter sp. M2C]UQG69921.1 3-dehydroquinate synthase [Marinobacter sp. M1C]
MPKLLRELEVDLGERSYPILIGQQLLGQYDLTPYVGGSQVMIVSNHTVAPLYLEQAKACFEGKQVDSVILPDGEKHKDWQTLNLIFDALLQHRHNRTTTLVALGGGVVGDMTGFAAASYQRGVAFIQVPTTLLSQVDSSVGGKTGINHPLGKNMIGAFHQPQVVLIDTDTLVTLPDREVCAGMAEVIKYGLIRDLPFLHWLDQNLESLLEKDPLHVAEAIYRSCVCKAEVVAIDEREGGLRAILNLGHTFGHAIETFAGYGNWLHGEAVGTGMLMAADLSAREGFISAAECQQIYNLISRAGLPPLAPVAMRPDDFIERMAVDKKNVDGQLRLVLLQAVGEAVVTAKTARKNLEATLNAFCQR